jgi:hypothetical protein
MIHKANTGFVLALFLICLVALTPQIRMAQAGFGNLSESPEPPPPVPLPPGPVKISIPATVAR